MLYDQPPLVATSCRLTTRYLRLNRRLHGALPNCLLAATPGAQNARCRGGHSSTGLRFECCQPTAFALPLISGTSACPAGNSRIEIRMGEHTARPHLPEASFRCLLAAASALKLFRVY